MQHLSDMLAYEIMKWNFALGDKFHSSSQIYYDGIALLKQHYKTTVTAPDPVPQRTDPVWPWAYPASSPLDLLSLFYSDPGALQCVNVYIFKTTSVEAWCHMHCLALSSPTRRTAALLATPLASLTICLHVVLPDLATAPSSAGLVKASLMMLTRRSSLDVDDHGKHIKTAEVVELGGDMLNGGSDRLGGGGDAGGGSQLRLLRRHWSWSSSSVLVLFGSLDSISSIYGCFLDVFYALTMTWCIFN